jgi:hypothetical protein
MQDPGGGRSGRAHFDSCSSLDHIFPANRLLRRLQCSLNIRESFKSAQRRGYRWWIRNFRSAFSMTLVVLFPILPGYVVLSSLGSELIPSEKFLCFRTPLTKRYVVCRLGFVICYQRIDTIHLNFFPSQTKVNLLDSCDSGRDCTSVDPVHD